VVGFLNGISSEQMARLQAYGLNPGQGVRVLQRSPLIVVEVDYLELAVERELACSVQVDNIGEGGGSQSNETRS
jgi:Fe2+ transport system protein FeoA